MKNGLLFVLALIFGTLLHAQDNPRQIGIHFSISNFSCTEPLSPANRPGSGVVQVSPGIDYQHFFTDRLAAFSALGFTVFAEKTDNRDLRWPSEHNGSGGWTPDPSLPHQSETKTSYFYLDWQVGLKYVAIQRKLSLFVLPYLESNFLIDRQLHTQYIYDDGRVESIPTSDAPASGYDGLRKVNLSAGLGIGLQYSIAQRLNLYLMPQAEMMLQPATEEGDGRFVNYGSRLGLWYGF